jgi:hypothetical protein
VSQTFSNCCPWVSMASILPQERRHRAESRQFMQIVRRLTLPTRSPASCLDKRERTAADCCKCLGKSWRAGANSRLFAPSRVASAPVSVSSSEDNQRHPPVARLATSACRRPRTVVHLIGNHRTDPIDGPMLGGRRLRRVGRHSLILTVVNPWANAALRRNHTE